MLHFETLLTKGGNEEANGGDRPCYYYCTCGEGKSAQHVMESILLDDGPTQLFTGWTSFVMRKDRKSVFDDGSAELPGAL